MSILESETAELHPELEACLEKNFLGMSLKHPLVFEIIYHPVFNARLNEALRLKTDYANRALAEKNYSQYIWLHERPYRFQKFLELSNVISDEQYWKILGEIWIDSENLWQYKKFFKNVFNCQRKHREKIMSKTDRSFLDGLPEKITIYRGFQSKNKNGFSWSLSYWKAKWFANRFEHKGRVIQGIVDKKKVIAVMTGRSEYEVIIDPSEVKEKIVDGIANTKNDWVDDLSQKLKIYSKGNSVHNFWHWEKVEHNARKLCSQIPEADETVCRLFAWIHDTQRISENDDPEHGLRAADFAKILFQNNELLITKNQLNLLAEACEDHEKGKTSSDPTIGVCWDSDRLDLSRVGITPEPTLLSTAVAKQSIWTI